jgi:DNA-binding PadR family transcriptional regulator
MVEEDTFDKLPWLSDDDWRRLGFFQLSILSSLLTQERYGLEIRDYLMLNGYEIGTNQLYQTLSKMESSGKISSREEERKGVNRKFYHLTDKGRSLFVQYSLNFIMLFQDVYPAEYLTPLSDLAWEMLGSHITSSSIIFDFSIRYTDNQFEPIVSISRDLTPPGHVYLLSQKEEYAEIVENKIIHYGLEKIVSVKAIDQRRLAIPENSIDLVICNFMLHYPHNRWIIPEMGRILKSGGYFLISNPLMLEEEKMKDIRFALMVSLRQLSPSLPKSGIDEAETIEQLRKNNLQISERKLLNGVLFLLGKKHQD